MPSFDTSQLMHFPLKPGVYLMKNAKGSVLYIGKAKNLQTRVRQYFSKTPDSRAMVPFLTSEVSSVETIIVPTEKEALLLENTLIKKHKPKYNVLLKDDKSFITLCLDKTHPWPTLRLVRYKNKPGKEVLCFGPYPNAHAAREAFELLLHLFPLRQCSDAEFLRRKRPCLLYSIHRCPAPCVGRCSHEEYDGYVQGAIQFLKRDNCTLLKNLKKEMEEASKNLEFEKAAMLFQTMQKLEMIQKPTSFPDLLGENRDIEQILVVGICRQAGEEGRDRVAIVEMLYQKGELVSSEPSLFEGVIEEDEEVVFSFLLQRYEGEEELNNPLPGEIVLPAELTQPNLSAIGEIFFERYKKTPHFPLLDEKEKVGKQRRKALELALSIARENAHTFLFQKSYDLNSKEQLLLELQETCSLSRYPRRIECFDASHFSGTERVASMVAFTEGKKDGHRKRLFRIRESASKNEKKDDCAALKQALTRRLERAQQEEDLPDLILIDGGKGQLHTAMEVFKKLDIASIDLLALTKEEGRHDKGLTQERILMPYLEQPILLKASSSLLFFLQGVRDEAHHAAISFQKKRRNKALIRTELDQIPGIGPVKRARLLKRFGSLKRIRNTPVEEIAKVPGISRKDAENIVQALDN